MARDKSSIIKSAQKFAARGQIDKALAEWQKILDDNPSDGNVHNTVGDLHLKKNDKVCTIGGIYGTVIEVRDKEIVIKIDESNNTKMKVTPGAIRNVATEEREN